MREIEFRGKAKDSNEWMFGYYLHVPEKTITTTDIFKCEERHEILNLNENQFPYWYRVVMPETVGQYIVKKDKNDIKIFSGDVVKNGLSGTWIIQPLENGAFSLLGICKKYKDSVYDISALNSDVEVIGNIHDNPELLEGIK
jgi:uncharacterized phage protein (TIGR01671 family)